MQLRQLGTTDLQVSEICLGTMQFKWLVGEKESFDILDAFLDAGGNFLDTADMYSQWAKGFAGGESETVIGKWMKQRKNRNKVVLATKARCRMWEGPDGEGLSREHILRACEDSLKRLQTDHIDLYQSHWPDAKTPAEETLAAYGELARQGKIRYAGCSNYSGSELKESLQAGERAGTSYVCVQPYYNLIGRKDFERDVLPLVLERKLGVIPYSPLDGGFLTGKYRPGQPPPKSVRAKKIVEVKLTEKNMAVLDRLEAVGKKYKKSIAQTALVWLLSRDWITAPIIGANSLEQLQESLGAAGFRLETADKIALDQLTADL